MGLIALWHVGSNWISDQTHFSCIHRRQLFFFLIYLLFNSRIISLQNVFCQTSAWISHIYIYIYICSLLLEPPSHLSPHPTPLGRYQAPIWVLRHIANSHWLSILHMVINVSFPVTLSIRLTLSSPLPVSISLFSMSVSPQVDSLPLRHHETPK